MHITALKSSKTGGKRGTQIRAMAQASGGQEYLQQFEDKDMPVPPFDRYIYVLPTSVVKKRLSPGQTGLDGYTPDFATLTARDENELKALEMVREHTKIPVPRVLQQGDGSAFSSSQQLTSVKSL